MRGFLHSRALSPLIPPASFSHTGRRGRWGVLMPETEDGTQGLATAPHPPAPFSHTGGRGRRGVLMPETGEGTQGFPQNLPLQQTVRRNSFRSSRAPAPL